MKTSSPLSALALSLAAALTAQAEDSTTVAAPQFIHRLIQEAVTTHPSIAAAEARTQAAKSAIGAVRLWEDPQLGLGLTAARRSMRQDDGDVFVGFDQMLPRPGLYKAEKRRATVEQQVRQSMRQQTAAELGLSVSQAVLELALADELIRLQTENLVWLRTIVKTAEERAKNPDATATETLRLESELAMRAQTLASLKRQRVQFSTTLNLLLGRAADTPWQSLVLDGNASELATATALKARLEKDNPQLAVMRHQIEGAQAEADAAREKRKPAFSIGVETNTYSGGDFRDAMFAVKMTLPWFNRSVYKADIARAESLRDASRSDLAAQQRELYSQITTLLTEAQNNQQTVRAYNDEVLPKTVKAVETLQNAWVSSKATLLEVLDARRSLLEARQEQKRALTARHVAAQALTALTGGHLKSQGN
ncbi:MAG: TolC family protein [Verrucomicrobiaceae bacterium]|nr:TolC family protein [Verrucomicrobiaceae bacterium]